jgi:hypothetical protein
LPPAGSRPFRFSRLPPAWYTNRRACSAPTREDIDALAQHWADLNRQRPQARSWSERDGRNLTRLSLFGSCIIDRNLVTEVSDENGL